MKCINKLRVYLFTACCIFITAGCGKEEEIALEQPYSVYESSEKYGLTARESLISSNTPSFFAKDLCVIADKDSKDNSKITSSIARSIGVFSIDDSKVLYNKGMFAKMYPASTTKIMTAYLALKYSKPDELITVSDTAVDLPGDASKCGLKAGDKLTMEQLLYGLMLKSGNDAAIAIAESISGSSEAFSELMNKEARLLGATRTNFVNSNGLHVEDHYTTAYDLYLIFNAAVKQKEFVDIISTPTYHAEYTSADGTATAVDWSTTNRFLNGVVDIPEGVSVIGGKTGTTDPAGHCDVLYSLDKNGKHRISVVMNCDTTDNMYVLLSELIAEL